MWHTYALCTYLLSTTHVIIMPGHLYMHGTYTLTKHRRVIVYMPVSIVPYMHMTEVFPSHKAWPHELDPCLYIAHVTVICIWSIYVPSIKHGQCLYATQNTVTCICIWPMYVHSIRLDHCLYTAHVTIICIWLMYVPSIRHDHCVCTHHAGGILQRL